MSSSDPALRLGQCLGGRGPERPQAWIWDSGSDPAPAALSSVGSFFWGGGGSSRREHFFPALERSGHTLAHRGGWGGLCHAPPRALLDWALQRRKVQEGSRAAPALCEPRPEFSAAFPLGLGFSASVVPLLHRLPARRPPPPPRDPSQGTAALWGQGLAVTA